MKNIIIAFQFEREKGLKMKDSDYKVKMKKEEEVTEEVVEMTLKRALRNVSMMQADDGFWPGDYGGPLFLMPSLVIISFSLSLLGIDNALFFYQLLNYYIIYR